MYNLKSQAIAEMGEGAVLSSLEAGTPMGIHVKCSKVHSNQTNPHQPPATVLFQSSSSVSQHLEFSFPSLCPSSKCKMPNQNKPCRAFSSISP